MSTSVAHYIPRIVLLYVESNCVLLLFVGNALYDGLRQVREALVGGPQSGVCWYNDMTGADSANLPKLE